MNWKLAALGSLLYLNIIGMSQFALPSLVVLPPLIFLFLDMIFPVRRSKDEPDAKED